MPTYKCTCIAMFYIQLERAIGNMMKEAVTVFSIKLNLRVQIKDVLTRDRKTELWLYV